jgi:hypothetical protein
MCKDQSSDKSPARVVYQPRAARASGRRDRTRALQHAGAIPSRLRRLAARLSGFRLVPFDPVLRDRTQDPARREAWLHDQYQHPEEHTCTLAEVQRWFAENRVEYLRAYPSAVLGEEPEELFARAAENWGLESWFAQVGWMRTLVHEGGLFFTIGRACRIRELCRRGLRGCAAVHLARTGRGFVLIPAQRPHHNPALVATQRAITLGG